MKYFILFFTFFFQISFAQIPTNCFEIESILVDACGGSVEGLNEMVRFTVGPAAINVSDLGVSGGINTAYNTGKWPTGNLFLGISNPPAAPAKVDSINATITSCGLLIEPANGILLPGMKVLLITSYAFTTMAQSFTTLGDTLYVIFQNSINQGGNFSNYTGGSPTNNRNFVLVNTATGCTDTVKYKPALLSTQSGSGDGDAVSYTWSGTATYYNNGCQAPFEPKDPSWTPPGPMCAIASPINLNNYLTGTLGGTWSGSGVSDSIFDPAGLSGNINITYTINQPPCTSYVESHIIQVIASGANAGWNAPLSICQAAAAINLDTTITGATGGVWSGTGITDSAFSPTGLLGPISITYTVGIAPCQATETHIINVVSVPDASWTTPASICTLATAIDLSSQIDGTTGGTWSGNGVTDSIFNPAGLSGNINITYTVGVPPCTSTVSHAITITPAPSAAWTPPDTMCTLDAATDLNATIIGLAGGTWSGSGVSDSIFNPAGLSGSISITYTAGTAPCQSSQAHSIYVDGAPDASWSSPNSLCQTGGSINLNTTITGDAGGTWSGSGITDSIFNPTSLSGNIQVTYTVGIAPCQSQQAHTITVIPPPNTSWTPPSSVCTLGASVNLDALVTGVSGGTWIGTGVSNNMFNPAGLNGNIAITYTISVGGCSALSTQNILVVAAPNASWLPQDSVCESSSPINLDSLVTGLAGGVWSGIGVTANQFDPTGLNGSVNITYTVGVAPCSTSTSHTVLVIPSSSSTWISPDTICQAESPINLNSLISGDWGGTWSGTGVSANIFNPSGLNGNYAITYTIGISPCISSTVHTIRVDSIPNPTWTPLNPLCQTANPVNLNTQITGTTGGVWTGIGVTGNTFNPIGLSGIVTISYTIGIAPCQSTEAHTVNVSAAPNSTWLAPSTVCQNGGQVNLNSLITGSVGGSFSGSGVVGNFFIPTGLVGNQEITYSVVSGSCSSSTIDTIKVIVAPPISIMNPEVFCNRTGYYNLDLLIIGVPNGTWSGSHVENSFLLLDSLSGNTIVTYTAVNLGCTTVVAKTIILDSLHADFTASPYGGDAPLEVTFTNSSVGSSTYEWSFGNNHISEEKNPVETFNLDGTYTVVLTAHSKNGCIDTASCVIEVIPADVFIPNSFTPNNDGKNELFAPVISGHVDDYSFFIYNRWGEKIFESVEQNAGWDGKVSGKIIQQGVYTYVVYYTIPGKTKRKVGVLYLLR